MGWAAWGWGGRDQSATALVSGCLCQRENICNVCVDVSNHAVDLSLGFPRCWKCLQLSRCLEEQEEALIVPAGLHSCCLFYTRSRKKKLLYMLSGSFTLNILRWESFSVRSSSKSPCFFFPFFFTSPDSECCFREQSAPNLPVSVQPCGQNRFILVWKPHPSSAGSAVSLMC